MKRTRSLIRWLWVFGVMLACQGVLGQSDPTVTPAGPCDEPITVQEVTIVYPGVLAPRSTASYQPAMQYRHEYVYAEDFETEQTSEAIVQIARARWERVKGKARSGQGFIGYTASAESLAKVAPRPQSDWLVFGPFNLDSCSDGLFSYYVQLGDTLSSDSGSVVYMVSVDGRTFHGYKASGRTCAWLRRYIDLIEAPGLGDVCRSKTVWFAILPGGGQLQIDDVRLRLDRADLPPRVHHTALTQSTTVQTTDHQSLLAHYAPYIKQSYHDDWRYFSDFITRVDFDGNFVGNDNWDNLGSFYGYGSPVPCCDCNQVMGGPCVRNYPLRAYVYSTVMETPTHFYLWYAFYHPTDHYCSADAGSFGQHEGDLEGMVVQILKDGSTYGSPQVVQLQAHTQYFYYVLLPEDEPTWPIGDGSLAQSYADSALGIMSDNGAIDGFLARYANSHLIVYVEHGGHGIRNREGSFCDWSNCVVSSPYINYRYTGVASEPDHQYLPGQSLEVSYDFLSIFSDFWQRRDEHCGDGCLFDCGRDYQMQRAPSFGVLDIATCFDGNDCTADGANLPWWWDSDYDGSWYEGDWFMAIAHYSEDMFTYDSPLSLQYSYHPYVYNDLCGRSYNALRYFASPTPTYYHVNCDLEVPADQDLLVQSGVDVRFNSGTGIIADGPTTFGQSGGTTLVRAATGANLIIRLTSGKMRLHNGGGLRIYP